MKVSQEADLLPWNIYPALITCMGDQRGTYMHMHRHSHTGTEHPEYFLEAKVHCRNIDSKELQLCMCSRNYTLSTLLVR